MTALRDIKIALVALLAVALAGAQLAAHPAEPAVAAFPLVAIGLLAAAPTLARVQPATLIAGLVFALLVLDEASLPFNDWDPVTEALGPVLYGSFGELIGRPALLHGSPLEATTFALVLWTVFARGRNEVRNLLDSPSFRLVAALGGGLLAAVGLAVLVGFARGLPLGTAVTQVRQVPMVVAWLYLGYAALREPAHAGMLAKAVVAGAALKALQGWYCFFFVYGGTLGAREYLIEHVTSEHLMIAASIVAVAWLMKRRHIGHDLAALGLLALYAVPYVLNDRRASFAGVALWLAALPFFYPRFVRRWHLVAGGGVAAVALVVAVAKWDALRPLLFDEFDSSLGYREVETFNLLTGVMKEPLTGLGFGARLEQALELVDISSVYAWYDVLPHNNALWVWCQAGPLGFAALGTLIVMALATFLRLDRRAREAGADWRTSAVAFVGLGMTVRWLLFLFTDMGLNFVRLSALLALAIGCGVSSLRRLEATDATP